MADTLRATDLAELLKSMGADVHEYVEKALAPIKARQEELAQRLDALEQRRVMTFTGPHDPAREYYPGEVSQRGGSTWVCMVSTAEAPGASPAWRQLSKDAR